MVIIMDTNLLILAFEIGVWALGAAVLFLARRYLGVRIEASDREALQSALRNAARYGIERAGVAPGTVPSNGTIASAARSYLRQSVPDALKRFGLEDAAPAAVNRLDALLAPHVAEAKVRWSRATAAIEIDQRGSSPRPPADD